MENKKTLIREYLKEIILGVLIVVLGILFCIYKTSIMDTLEIIFIVISICYGTLVLLMYFGFNRNESDLISVFQSILYIVFGFLTLLINDFFLYAIALNMALLGIRYIFTAVKSNVPGHKLMLTFSILSLVLSLIILVTCIFSLPRENLMIIIGCCLMVIGLLYVFLTCLLIKINALISRIK